MMIKMLRPGRALAQDEVAALEARLRLKLPSDYRQFLNAQNGGLSAEYETKFFHRFYEEKHTLILFDWFPVLAEEEGRLTIEAGIRNLKRLLPSGMIPIAQGIGGEPVLLSMNDENYGFVFVLDTEAPDQRSLSVVAKSFTEFLGLLRPHSG